MAAATPKVITRQFITDRYYISSGISGRIHYPYRLHWSNRASLAMSEACLLQQTPWQTGYTAQAVRGWIFARPIGGKLQEEY
jgi:hypothetical protein